MFPQPKVARRFATAGATQWWGYAAGEFGGGTWSIQRADGRGDSVDSNDLRLVVGVEQLTPGKLSGCIETGYVCDRQIISSGSTPDFDPDPTFMLRVGFSY